MNSKSVQELAVQIGITLDRFIHHEQSAFPYATGELSHLLRDIALAGKIINREVNRAGLIDLSGAIGQSNVQGESQQKLDVIANIRFLRALQRGGEVCAIISEEDEGIIYTNNDNGKYVVAIDPLDGSSNIDVNVSIGTIFRSTAESVRWERPQRWKILCKVGESRWQRATSFMDHQRYWFTRPEVV